MTPTFASVTPGIVAMGVLVGVLVGGLAGCGTSEVRDSFTPADFRASYPPTERVEVVNTGLADPLHVYDVDFADDTTLIGSSHWVGSQSLGLWADPIQGPRQRYRFRFRFV